MNICVCFLRFGPYHWARFAALRRHAEVTAVELNPLDLTYAWEEPVPLPGVRRLRVEAAAGESRYASVARALSTIQPDVVCVPGWADPFAAAVLLWCISAGVPTVLMSDSRRDDRPRRPWEEWVKRRIVALHGAAVVAGTAHASYMTILGMPASRVFRPCTVVDNDYFAAGAQTARANRSVLLTQYGLPEKYFLVCNRFVAKKNMERVLHAFALYRQHAGRNAWPLVLVGDGPLKEHLFRQRDDLGLSDTVSFHGFRQYGELPVFYGLAGAFISASTADQWGLVVNEAMAAGLPVLVSERMGASELVDRGRNGNIFNPFDHRQLADLMLHVSSGEQDLRAMGKASSEIVALWSPDRFADAMVLAAGVARQTQRRRSVLWDSLILHLLSRSFGVGSRR
jgi:glycosyltransferase involved in cell wall biosynthesis